MSALRTEIQFTSTGLSLPPDLSFDEWQDYGERLFAMERGVMWAIGDWWRYGEHRYGERAAQALDSRYAYGTLANAGYVAAAIEPSRRREVLSFAHHQEVAALPIDEQDYWLDEAERGEWSRNDLRTHIKRGRAPDDAPVIESPDIVRAVVESVERLDDLRLQATAESVYGSLQVRSRAAFARRLRLVGTYLGQIAFAIEEEDRNVSPAA